MKKKARKRFFFYYSKQNLQKTHATFVRRPASVALFRPARRWLSPERRMSGAGRALCTAPRSLVRSLSTLEKKQNQNFLIFFQKIKKLLIFYDFQVLFQLAQTINKYNVE